MLIEFAKNRAENALRSLKLLADHHQKAEQKLALLTRYAREYEQQLKHHGHQGITAHELHNFQVFLAKLEEAIRQQRDETDSLQSHRAQAHTRWQDAERRRASFDALKLRDDQAQSLAEARHAQKLIDAYAGQQAARKLNSR
jgi:flagellar protein FliJ